MSFLFAFLLLIAPLYVWRFSIGGIPTNFLMLANFVVIGFGILFLLKDHNWKRLKDRLLELGKPILITIGLIGLASLISLFAFGVTAEKLAQWVVLYAQPITLFVLYRYFASKDDRAEKIFKLAAYLIVSTAGALALLQYFTLATLPEQWWGNANEPKRAIAFFAHANAYGLFVTPILAWLIPDVVQKVRDNQKYLFGLAWFVGAVGVFLSLSRGAWLGLILAAGIYVLVSANKKMIIGFAVAGLVMAGIVAAVPNLRYRVMLPFHGEKSAVARLSLWDTGLNMVKDSPVLGKGINGFNENWDLYNKDSNLEHYNFPHNIFLNFWIDLGLLGALSMMSLLAIIGIRGLLKRFSPAAVSLLLVAVAVAAHGLIDIPYLKNDLALIFWLLLAVSL